MRNICILFLLLSTTIFSQIKSGKVTYVVSMEPFSEKWIDSISKKNKSPNKRVDAWSKGIYKNIKDVKTMLVFSNEESLYTVENKMKNDGKTAFNMNRVFAGGDNKFYKNTKTKEYFYESNLTELLLTEIIPKKWKITQESKKIGNYLCYKAIDIASKNKKMKPIVWFTPQIPVSFGPHEYNGLPGLVLLVEMGKRKIEAEKIILNPKKKIVIKKPTKGKKITAKESQEKAAKFWKSIQKVKE